MENIEIRKISKLPWYVQIFQNSLSLWSTLPLGIIDFDYSEIMRNNILSMEELNIKQNQLKEWADPKLFFSQFQENNSSAHKMIKYLTHNELTSWKSTLSYTYPLVEEVRRWDWWRVWEELFFYNLIVDSEKKDTGIKNYFDPLKVRLIPIENTNNSLFIVFGPVAFDPEIILGQQMWHNKVAEVFVEPIFEFAGKDKSSLPFSQWELKSLSSVRKPLNESDFSDKVEIAFATINSFKKILYKNNVFEDENFLRRNIPSFICGILSILHNPYNLEEIKKHLSPQSTDSSSSIFRKNNSPKLPPQNLHFELGQHTKKKLIAYRRDNNWDIQVKEIEPLSATNEEAQKYILNQFRKNEWHYQNRYEGYCIKKIVYLHNRLEKQFGIMSSSNEDRDDKEIFDILTREVANLVTADAANIYFYNFTDNYLDLKWSYYRNPDGTDIENGARWKDAMKNVMKVAGGDDTETKKSICYRAFNSNVIRFCRAFDPKTGQSDPIDEPLLPQPQNYPSLRSGIASPLRVQGKTYGVLELGGLFPYQFRWYNTYLIRRIAEMISPIFYRRDTLYRLENLSRFSLDSSTDLREIYSNVAKDLCSIFLVAAGCLWMPDSNRPHLFAPAGWWGRSDLDKFYRNSQKNIFCNSRRKDEMIYRGISSKDHFSTISVEELLTENPVWADKKEDRIWISREVKNLVLIPIRLPGTNDPLAVLELYYKQNEIPLNDHWKPIIEFVVFHLVVLIQAIISQAKRAFLISQMIGHELKQNVDTIMNRSESLLEQFERIFIMVNKYRKMGSYTAFDFPIIDWFDKNQLSKKIKMIDKDLHSYIKSTHNLISFMQDHNKIEKKRKTSYHPLIHYRSMEFINNPIEIINFRKFFNEVFRHYWSTIKKKSLKDTQYSGPIDGPFIKIHPEILRGILDNLANNSFKYAIPKSQIIAETRTTEFSFIFSLSNEAKCLEESSEQYTIFNELIRGTNTDNLEGEGLGLFIARSYCELYGGELNLSSMEPLNKGICIFTFELIFPRTMLNE